MNVRKILALRGPNRWACCPILEAWLEPDEALADVAWLRSQLPTFFPELIERHREHNGNRVSLNHLDSSTDGIQLLAEVVLALQNRVGCEVEFYAVRCGTVEGMHQVAIECPAEALGRACLMGAIDLLEAISSDFPFDLPSLQAKLLEIADEVCLGPSTLAIVDAARERDIPIQRLSTQSLVQLGQGRHQHRVWTAVTDRTSAVGESIAGDKELTKRMLRSVGVPVPKGRVVVSAEDAWHTAMDLGLPVVVKPLNGNQGRGVSIALTLQEEIESAFHLAKVEEPSVLVESWAPGTGHRLLVVGGRVVAASRADVEQVIGDGLSTIRELIAKVNDDPRRGSRQDKTMSLIELDPIALAVLRTQGFSPDAVPEAGQSVVIHYNGDYTTDETALVHHSVAMHAVRAAEAVGLDIAGIDVVAENVGRPLEQQGGVIVEVNAGPSLKMHVQPIVGSPQPVGEAIVDTMFGRTENGRIPIIAIAAADDTASLADHAVKQLQRRWKNVGHASDARASVAGRPIFAATAGAAAAAELVLLNRSVDAAVFELNAESLAGEGLPFDRPRIAVVTDSLPSDSLVPFGIETRAEVAELKGVLVEALTSDDWAVLNADDPFVADLVHRTSATVIFYSDGSELRHLHCEERPVRCHRVWMHDSKDWRREQPSSALMTPVEAALEWAMELAFPFTRAPLRILHSETLSLVRER